MDPFEHLPEAPDLSGDVVVLSYKPVYTGPYSCIYRGKLRSSGKLVALKVLNAIKGMALQSMQRKLLRERRTWGALSHPNILPLYGFANDEDLFEPFGALVSPWWNRGDAADFLAECGSSMNHDQRLELWKEVIAGVSYLHSHQPLLVHGDLKPRNILIDDTGHAQICDFGLVRILPNDGRSCMTTTTHHTGTERYLAYELVAAGEDAKPTTYSDIYAIGCIGLEFIFSQLPHAKRRNNFGGRIYSDIKAGVPPAEAPVDSQPHIQSIWTKLEWCWEKEPTNRPSSELLHGWLEGRIPQPVPVIYSTPSLPTPVSSRYQFGKLLGSGTYTIIKEAINVENGIHFACRVINKKPIDGWEQMVKNEIQVLKHISGGNQNIIALRDYFETLYNHYLIFDLCTGGELFDGVLAKKNYFEPDAADLVRTIMSAVQHIHSMGIVHRDLKPENILFRNKEDKSDIMITGFGLSKIVEENKPPQLTEVCGTPSYMAPEIFQKSGYGKAVDIWAMGVITYLLLCGYMPFDRNTRQEEIRAIIGGDYKFKPTACWGNVSEVAQNFVQNCLILHPDHRHTAKQLLEHKWLADPTPHFVVNPNSRTGQPAKLLPHSRKQFDARKAFRRAVHVVIAIKRMSPGSAEQERKPEKKSDSKKKFRGAVHVIIAIKRMLVGTQKDHRGVPRH